MDFITQRPETSQRVELRIFTVAVAVIALHVVDDSFLQPQPGTSAGDHLVSGLVPLAVLALAAALYPRAPGGARAAWRCSSALAGSSPASRPCTTRPRSAHRVTTSRGCSPSPPASSFWGSVR